MTTTSPTSRAEMMFLGQECKHPACHLHDFLPFSCPACHQSFCQPHFLPSQHNCTAPLPPSMVDRIAPVCPMCAEIVPYPKSSTLDPNEAVERHILSGTCTGFVGGEERKKAEAKRRRDNGEVCWRKTCGKVLVVKMKCEQCQHMFCPSHRTPNSHSCTPNSTPSTSRTTTPQPPISRPAGKAAFSRLAQSVSASSSSKPSSSTTSVPIKANPLPPPQPSSSSNGPTPITASSGPSEKLDARAAAAAAALKRAGHDVKVPFVKTKTEKRSQAELNSTIQALKVRHDKGLLSKAEEVRYAELVGEREASKRIGGGKTKGGKGDCVIA
ncbi:hypothetical protein CI109_100493 [Kwoniella shandongensis]|uniref:Uncharacterized protein n=1 Tax=Kwoniella shandongensis TaxID=1734106 RepID=A0A5M6C8G4_9TREE|nr:uncharacterized protein CI109_001664 [Kwoniella shandongensis]KAA5529725.1 hypothetical protein CI109_001664 [Kwoniella shandongensis]